MADNEITVAERPPEDLRLKMMTMVTQYETRIGILLEALDENSKLLEAMLSKRAMRTSLGAFGPPNAGDLAAQIGRNVAVRDANWRT